MWKRLLFVSLVLLAGCATVPSDGTQTPGPTATHTTAGSEPAPPESGAATLTVTVREVVDGDTLDVTYENGTRDTVRLVGVDTPEVHTAVSPGEFEGIPDTEAGRACLREWGERASSHVKDRLAGETVTLHFDPNLDRRGYYGRLLAYVTVDGRHVNYRLVSGGYARVYDSDFALKSEFLGAESRAQQDGTGLWTCATDGGATTTRTRTPGNAPLSVSVHPNAAGDDNDNLNDEYVTFENRESSTRSLEGWTVSDAAGHTYTFGALELASGESVTLFTGSGTDSASARYWGSGRPIWNNGGDTVIVRNASGGVVVEYRYGG